jgi:hypothetical protein
MTIIFIINHDVDHHYIPYNVFVSYGKSEHKNRKKMEEHIHTQNVKDAMRIGRRQSCDVDKNSTEIVFVRVI